MYCNDVCNYIEIISDERLFTVSNSLVFRCGGRYSIYTNIDMDYNTSVRICDTLVYYIILYHTHIPHTVYLLNYSCYEAINKC